YLASSATTPELTTERRVIGGPTAMSPSEYNTSTSPLSRGINQSVGNCHTKHITSRNVQPKPQALKPNHDGFPTELKAIPHWFAWRYEWKNARWAKVPVNPHTGRNGDASDLTTEGTFDEAWARYESDDLDGVGFVFTENDPYVGVD